MTTFQWRELMTQWSEDILNSSLASRMSYLITPTAVAARWLGYSGATEEQIAAAEARLGSRLPPSYRSFLAVSNGWSVLTHFTGQLWPTDTIAWFRERNQEWIDILTEFGEEHLSDADYAIYGPGQNTESMRTKYLRTALEISNPDYRDSHAYLLNPEVVTADGEWEAWRLAAESCRRYRSFWKLMQAEYEHFLHMKDM